MTQQLRGGEPVGTRCIDGQTLNASDIARIQDQMTARSVAVRRAVLAVANYSETPSECRDLLDMLGIDLATVAQIRVGAS